ncbi:MAG TPA: hypothetical protein VL866_06445 [Pyrinomonadaceae bacterium]|nr:hypothetical protein [Pyrinomonadaceae bacterium]
MEKFRGQSKISFRYSEHLGPRCEAAGVSLVLITDDNYEFVSNAHWPEEDFVAAVERGVRDGLFEAGFDPDLGVSVLLEAVEYDPIDSCERAFYVAAKCAALARVTIRR